jgi:hypothetical protein
MQILEEEIRKKIINDIKDLKIPHEWIPKDVLRYIVKKIGQNID